MKIQLIAKAGDGIQVTAKYESDGKIIPTENHLVYAELIRSTKEIYKIIHKKELNEKSIIIDLIPEFEVEVIQIPDNIDPFKSLSIEP